MNTTTNKAFALAQLTGNENQVAWAIEIRDRKMKEIVNIASFIIRDIASLVAKGAITQEAADAKIAKYNIAPSILAAETDSRFWIDARDSDAYPIVSAVVTNAMIAEYIASKSQAINDDATST